MNARVVAVVALAVALAATSIGVVYSKHESRRLFTQLEDLNRERDELNAEWGMLQLEQGAWATHGRVERIARERLEMRLPARGDVVILRQRGRQAR